MGNQPSSDTPSTNKITPDDNNNTQKPSQVDPNVPPDVTPSCKEMAKNEADCATCEHKCDVLEYPGSVLKKIDKDFVLNGSGKVHRWHIVLSSGISPDKWPHTIAHDGNFAECVTEAAKKHPQKSRISYASLAPESGCNSEDACDLLIFPEAIRYCNVEKDQVEALLDYHFSIIAPRHQTYLQELDAARAHDPNAVISVENPTYTDAQRDEITAATVLPANASKFVFEYDTVEHGIGKKFPVPKDLEQRTWVFFCGHKLRDARCGATAPILVEQLEMVIDQVFPQLQGKIGVDRVSHLGGHKVAALAYIHQADPNHFTVFYGRILPEHVQNIVEKTIINGELLLPLTRAASNDLY